MNSNKSFSFTLHDVREKEQKSAKENQKSDKRDYIVRFSVDFHSLPKTKNNKQ